MSDSLYAINLKDDSYRINIHNGLLLYHNQYSYYSQKVLMALYEKKLPFESHIIYLSKSVQYEPWFLQLNPRGEVPVLQDGGKIISDSNTIMDYLEDNFSSPNIPKLVPIDEGHEVRQKVSYFRNLLDQIPSGVITIGSFVQRDLVKAPKIPFHPCVRKILLNPEKNSVEYLQKHAENNPRSKDILLQKIEAQKKKYALINDRKEFMHVLNQMGELLDKVEEELASHTEKKDYWLCSQSFSIADINLTVLLERLYGLGFENHFWTKGCRPHIERYYERVKDRESYKKTMPGYLFHMRMLVIANQQLAIGLTAAAALAFVFGGFLIARKLLV